jgi:invasion protein IalB
MTLGKSIASYAARCAIGIAAAVLALGLSGALAQDAKQKQPPQKQTAPAKQPPAKQPAQAPQQPQQPGQPPAEQAAGEGQQMQIMLTPWTKICGKDQEANKEICLTTQEARADTGQLLASALVREVQDDPKKQFIVSVPVGMLLRPGMRVVVDQAGPQPIAYSVCFPNACYGDMEINAEYVAKLKKGQSLVIQTLNQVGRTINFPLSLKEFAKAYDGPPTDLKVVEEQQKKLQDELQKRAEEARKRLETTPGAGAPKQ